MIDSTGNGPLREPIDVVLDALRAARCDPVERAGKWTALCPAHDDTKPSLALRAASDGTVLVHYYSHQCKLKVIARIIGLTERDFFPTGWKVLRGPSRSRLNLTEFKSDGEFLDFLADWTFVLPDSEDCGVAAKLNLNASPYRMITHKMTSWKDRKVIVVSLPGIDDQAEPNAGMILDRKAREVFLWRMTGEEWEFFSLKSIRFVEPWVDNGDTVRKIEPQIEVNESADDPYRLGRILLAERCHEDGQRTLVFHRGEFQTWTGSAYRALPDQEVHAAIGKISKREFDRINVDDIQDWESRDGMDAKGKSCSRPTVRKVGTRLVGDIAAAVRSETILSGMIESPAWLISNPPFPATDVLPTQNALVHLPSFVEGRTGAICKPTPGFFCPYALDYPFDPNAPPPLNWIQFLMSVWPTDGESFLALQELMGYLLTLDNQQEKIAVFIGPTRSGKGTIAQVMSNLIGAFNVANPTMAGLSTQFGAEKLIGKPLAIIGDARLSAKSDWAVALERLLIISGNGAIDVDRKHKPTWTGKLPTRFLMVSNELPRFTDQAGALLARFLLFLFTESFLGKEDRSLAVKLQIELPGILLWAIEGWKRLRERGFFKQPKSGEEQLARFRDMASPVKAFIDDNCDIGAGFRVPIGTLFDAWKDWCLLKNRKAGSEQVFGRDLSTVLPALKVSRPRIDGTQVRHYEGLKLKSLF